MPKFLPLLVFSLIIISACVDSSQQPVTASGTLENAIVPAGWSTPVKLGFNDGGWEDSPYLTRDGQTLYFFYHPFPDLLTGLEEAMNIQFDGRIYKSQYPFATKELHPTSIPDMITEAGPYLSLSGDFYYHSNKRTIELQKVVPESIYRNGERLDLGTGDDETNPHYCDAEGELYFDAADHDILVYKNGSATLLPPPINLPGQQDFQPFLTDDCQTMYFTSNRGDSLAIYRTQRLGEFEWSEPELFISHPDGVGEFSMTSDEKRMAFAKISRTPNGGFTIDIYYSEKVG